jgi:hypothetical protein
VHSSIVFDCHVAGGQVLGPNVQSFELLAGFSITHLQFGPRVETETVQRSLSGRKSVLRFAVAL